LDGWRGWREARRTLLRPRQKTQPTLRHVPQTKQDAPRGLNGLLNEIEPTKKSISKTII